MIYYGKALFGSGPKLTAVQFETAEEAPETVGGEIEGGLNGSNAMDVADAVDVTEFADITEVANTQSLGAHCSKAERALENA